MALVETIMRLQTRDTEIFPAPYSADPLPDDLRRGLIPVAIFALFSVLSTSALLAWLTYRLIAWRRHYKTYIGYNQYVLLIYNLLLADLQQSLSFIISFHWLNENKMMAPTPACFAQAWLVQIGDISSGLFVLAIALHTFYSVVKGRQISFSLFICIVFGIWALALFLTIIGPAVNGKHYFTRAGAWCWVSDDFESERLYLHYIWIFIIEFGTMIIYAVTWIYLRKQINRILPRSHSTTPQKVSQAARYMVVYPIAYVVMTLPLAAGRMATMTGHTLPTTYYCIAGTLMTSCGWLDTALYTLTRRVLVSDQIDIRRSQRSRGHGGYEIDSFDGRSEAGLGHGADRSVTITGGGVLDGDRTTDGTTISTAERGRTASRRNGNNSRPRPYSDSTQDASPHGSTDTMIKDEIMAIRGVKAETKVEIRSERNPDYVSETASDVSGRTL